MKVLLATEAAAPGKPNEDFAAVAPGVAVLLDGAGLPPAVETGCAHGVAWYARTLGAALLAAIVADPSRPLRPALAQALAHVRAQHHRTCDLANPNSPAATVTAVRRSADGLDYLALSDSTVAAHWEDGREPLIVTDNRSFARGYVAKADPAAAERALVGRLPLAGLRGVALLSDGAARLADRFHLRSWPGVLDLIRDHGPAELLRQVRAAEASDPERTRWPRTKANDDATVIYWRITG